MGRDVQVDIYRNPEEYYRQVTRMVHEVRVNPHDQTLRDILSDLLEEHGRDGVAERTTRYLRAGKCVLASLDQNAISLLVYIFVVGKEKLPPAVEVFQVMQLAQVYVVEPVMLELLWALVQHYRGKFELVINLWEQTVLDEAELIHQDRANLGLPEVKLSLPGIEDGEDESETTNTELPSDPTSFPPQPPQPQGG